MGTLRMNGRIQQSTYAPLTQFTGVSRPSKLLASDGITIKDMSHLDNNGADYFTTTAQITAAVGDAFQMPINAHGDETEMVISMLRFTNQAIMEIYINGILDPVWSTINEAGKFYVNDGGVYTDDTTDAGDVGAGDVSMLPAVEAINDACLFGWGAPFRGVRIDIGTPGVGATGVWEYWNGAAWAAIPGVVDATSGLTAAAGNHDVTFTPPSDWAPSDPGAAATETLYYVQFRVTAANFSTIPIADQIWINGGYNNYAAAIGSINRTISLTQPILPGYNEIVFVAAGKHYSSAGWVLEFGGVSFQ